MSEKNVPVYQGEEGDTSTQIGWASAEEGGGRALRIDDEHRDYDVNNVWFGEPDPNAPVEEVDDTPSGDSDAEANAQPMPEDSAPVQTGKKK
jgi:hypothetical protein